MEQAVDHIVLTQIVVDQEVGPMVPRIMETIVPIQTHVYKHVVPTQRVG